MDVRTQPTRDGGPRTGRPPQLLLWILVGVIAVGLVFAALLGSLRDPDQLGLDTPEGVVQTYLQAVFDGDVATARGLLSEPVAARCSAREFRQAWVPDALTASLSEVRTQDDEVEVEVRLRTVEGPTPFGGGGYTTMEVFTLVEDGGEWRLSADPWPVYDCGGPR